MNGLKMGFVTVMLSVFGLTAVSAQPLSIVSTSKPVVDAMTAPDVSVTISGGFKTDPRDNGRPVVLIASMLGVTPDVFREAFSGVTPAKNGAPSQEQAQANKKALLKVLAPYGVTNEKLDAVSNYYRYRAAMGETWPQTQAAAEAVVVDGKISAIKIMQAGVGYTSIPKVVVRLGKSTFEGIATVLYTDDFKTNGSISAIVIKN